jgi:hypothetical protein
MYKMDRSLQRKDMSILYFFRAEHDGARLELHRLDFSS